MLVKTSDLIGPALDWAVAQAELVDVCIPESDVIWAKYSGPYNPSINWSDGGPLIEKRQIELDWNGVDGTAMWWLATHQDIAAPQIGDTPLIAACRAIVAAKLGDQVDVPDELMQS